MSTSGTDDFDMDGRNTPTSMDEIDAGSAESFQRPRNMSFVNHVPKAAKSEMQIRAQGPPGSNRFLCYDIVLGSGAFKTVYRGLDTDEGREVAWNELRIKRALSPRERERIQQEQKLLQALRHPNIISFYESWQVDAGSPRAMLVFITELAVSGTLKDYLRNFGRPKLKVLQTWCRQILKGLQHLHSRSSPLVHRDIKCDNIFLNADTMQVKIGDLGLATELKDGKDSLIGTPEFMAPEMYKANATYGTGIDIYAFGMCVLEMVTLEYPYTECQNVMQILSLVTQGIKPKAFDRLDPKDEILRSFILKCICVNPAERATAKDLLMHPFLTASDTKLDLHQTTLELLQRRDDGVLAFVLNKVTGDSKSREVKRTRIEFEVDADEDPAVVVESLISQGLIAQSDSTQVSTQMKQLIEQAASYGRESFQQGGSGEISRAQTLTRELDRGGGGGGSSSGGSGGGGHYGEDNSFMYNNNSNQSSPDGKEDKRRDIPPDSAEAIAPPEMPQHTMPLMYFSSDNHPMSAIWLSTISASDHHMFDLPGPTPTEARILLQRCLSSLTTNGLDKHTLNHLNNEVEVHLTQGLEVEVMHGDFDQANFQKVKRSFEENNQRLLAAYAAIDAERALALMRYRHQLDAICGRHTDGFHLEEHMPAHLEPPPPVPPHIKVSADSPAQPSTGVHSPVPGPAPAATDAAGTGAVAGAAPTAATSAATPSAAPAASAATTNATTTSTTTTPAAAATAVSASNSRHNSVSGLASEDKDMHAHRPAVRQVSIKRSVTSTTTSRSASVSEVDKVTDAASSERLRSALSATSPSAHSKSHGLLGASLSEILEEFLQDASAHEKIGQACSQVVGQALLSYLQHQQQEQQEQQRPKRQLSRASDADDSFDA
eukprot:m.136030 g.136030  ORF g.136030 m.136030 type:complete len:887 (+) comp16577_c0_seq2:351-3011(+)